SVFKVLCVVLSLQQLIYLITAFLFCQHFFNFLFSLLFGNWYIVSHLYYHVNYFFHCPEVKNNHLEMSGERGI
ncbi:MAG TPA: hypothetical protein DEQ64_11555, partial [Lachnoclostridium sp.]|nr:hypothetical protein [Lachnoclostridium sp.]